MNKIITVFKFEIGNYLKNKSFVVSTILIALLCLALTFAPRIIKSVKGEDKTSQETGAEETSSEDIDTLAVYDPNGIMLEELNEAYFGNQVKLQMCSSADEVKTLVNDEKAARGFIINSETAFDYIIKNTSLADEYSGCFEGYLTLAAKTRYCMENNLDYEKYMEVESIEVEANEVILGKDGASNYGYCYSLVIVVFMIIIMYGTAIATGVANEKGNRSMEILVTTASSTHLLFGKVFAGVAASLIQVGCIGAALLGGYQINKDYIGGIAATFLNIPSNVLITFIIFGIGGFLLYMFLYGALGALVSKVEDVNKSSGTAQMLIMIVYFAVLLNMQNIDGVIMKVCSFVPFSSYSAMFARVAMGSVETWEIVVSAVLLYATVFVVGLIGGKIFRSSTLRYGNPIKLSAALKSLKKKED